MRAVFFLRHRKLFTKDTEINIDVKPGRRAAANKKSRSGLWSRHAATPQEKMDVQPKSKLEDEKFNETSFCHTKGRPKAAHAVLFVWLRHIDDTRMRVARVVAPEKSLT